MWMTICATATSILTLCWRSQGFGRYFLEVMGGKPTGRIVPMSKLPPKSATIDGISWLPRLIAKARIKLRGEMDPDLMYGCAGDRPFLRKRHMTLPEFLQLVWDKGEDDRGIVEAVKSAAGRRASSCKTTSE